MDQLRDALSQMADDYRHVIRVITVGLLAWVGAQVWEIRGVMVAVTVRLERIQDLDQRIAGLAQKIDVAQLAGAATSSKIEAITQRLGDHDLELRTQRAAVDFLRAKLDEVALRIGSTGNSAPTRR